MDGSEGASEGGGSDEVVAAGMADGREGVWVGGLVVSCGLCSVEVWKWSRSWVLG